MDLRYWSRFFRNIADAGSDLSRIWDVDFRTQPTGTGAGLTGFAHLGQTMAHDKMLSWARCTTIFGATKAPLVDVADPDGLVRSQVVQSAALHVALNEA